MWFQGMNNCLFFDKCAENDRNRETHKTTDNQIYYFIVDAGFAYLRLLLDSDINYIILLLYHIIVLSN